MLPSIVESDPAQVWFGQRGYVLRRGEDQYSVIMGSALLGNFSSDDAAERDVLIAVVIDNLGKSVSWADVARAFRVGRATVGRVMQRYKAGGVKAVADTGHQGGLTKRNPQLDRRVFKLFEQGLGVRAVHRVVHKRISYGTVQAMHVEWCEQRAGRLQSKSEGESQGKIQQLQQGAPANDNSNATQSPGGERIQRASPSKERPDPLGLATEPSGHVTQRKERAPEELLPNGRRELVQHVGSWILLALVASIGVYDEAARWSSKISRVTLRVVIDAVAVALALGEGCVEGVRRIATPSASLLLRHNSAPGPAWVRRVLGRFAAESCLMFRARVTAVLLRRSSAARERVWLYVDNHMRPYTGQETIRKGWRMQSKRAVPGTSDCYVHDEDGCPLWRTTSNDHESLSVWLPRVLEFSRLVLGKKTDIILSFDRGGAYPATLAGLRDLHGGFVTYERKPYALIARTEFTKKIKITLPAWPKRSVVIRYTEARDKNLRKGRGRVRRIALLTEDGVQINLLTCSDAPAEELIRGHLARWGRQENQFKHEVERWGINQLDGREVEPYPPDAVIPNPDRRSIERKISLARAAEGRARCELAKLDPHDRERVLEDIERAVSRREELESLRPTMPSKAPVRETSLANKLVRHTTEYKNVVDTLRIVFANVEADLASSIAEHLERPREAKKVVANLFAAPGTVSLGKNSWRVRLRPAATPNERLAMAKLLRSLNQREFVLPGDPTGRRLHFSIAKGSHR